MRVLFPALPIIVLSAQGDDAPKVEALDLGADDYVAKPFSVRELLARVRVALRHAESAFGALAESSSLERGSIRLDLAEHTATVRGEVVSLTRTQFALLACFLRHPGRLLTHRAIVTEVWGDPDARRRQPARADLAATTADRRGSAISCADRDRTRARLPLPLYLTRFVCH